MLFAGSQLLLTSQCVRAVCYDKTPANGQSSTVHDDFKNSDKMAMKSSFGCASLQTGTLLIGWLGLVWKIFSAFAYLFYFIITSDESSNEVHRLKQYIDANLALTILVLSLAGVVILAHISLIHGAYKGHQGFLIPYLLVVTTSIGYNIVGLVSYLVIGILNNFILNESPEILLDFLLSLASKTYILCVVFSHYKELKYTGQKLQGSISLVAV